MEKSLKGSLMIDSERFVLFLSIYTFGFWFMCHFGGLIVDGEQQGKY